MKRSVAITSALLCAAFFANTTNAQNTSAESEFSLQGRLTSTSGSPIANGSHAITINVYARGSAQAIHTETDNVTTLDGIFSTMIGDNGSANLMVDANTDYEIGISVDGQAELTPRIRIGSVPSASTADVALDAKTVAGLQVSTGANPLPNSIVTLDANGKLNSSVLGSNLVTSINGVSGAVNFTGGGNLAVNTSGNTISLSLTGSGGGGLNLPFTQNLTLGSGQTGFNLSNAGAGSAATFINTAAGSALNLQAATGSALSATSNASGNATLDITNAGGAAIDASGSAATDAVIRVQNTSTNAQARLISALNAGGTAAFEVMANGQTSIESTVENALDVSTSATTGAAIRVQNTAAGANAKLISALNASGNAMFDVMANGQTMIRSSVANALDVSTTAAGEAALKVTGGLTLNGPVGTGAITTGNTSVTINNAYARANSVILLTVNSAVDALPIRISSQGNGTFTVSLLNSLVGSVTGNLGFNYVIINQ